MESKIKSNNLFKISDTLNDICKKIEDVNRSVYESTGIKETDTLSECVKKDVDEGMNKLYNLYEKYVFQKDPSREKIPTFSNFADYIMSKFFSKTYGIKELLKQNTKNDKHSIYYTNNIEINKDVPKAINNEEGKEKTYGIKELLKQNTKNDKHSIYYTHNIEINKNVPKKINNEGDMEKINTRNISGEADEMSK